MSAGEEPQKAVPAVEEQQAESSEASRDESQEGIPDATQTPSQQNSKPPLFVARQVSIESDNFEKSCR